MKRRTNRVERKLKLGRRLRAVFITGPLRIEIKVS